MISTSHRNYFLLKHLLWLGCSFGPIFSKLRAHRTEGLIPAGRFTFFGRLGSGCFFEDRGPMAGSHRPSVPHARLRPRRLVSWRLQKISQVDFVAFQSTRRHFLHHGTGGQRIIGTRVMAAAERHCEARSAAEWGAVAGVRVRAWMIIVCEPKSMPKIACTGAQSFWS